MKIMFIFLLSITLLQSAVAQEVDNPYLIDPSLIQHHERTETGYKGNLTQREAANYAKLMGLIKVTFWSLVLLGLIHAWNKRDFIKNAALKVYKQRAFRLMVSIYLFWSISVLFIYSDLAYNLFGIYTDNSGAAFFLLIVPPLLAVAFMAAKKWCKNGE